MKRMKTKERELERKKNSEIRAKKSEEEFFAQLKKRFDDLIY